MGHCESRSKDKGKAQGDEHADGTWSGEQSDAWWKTSNWQTGSGLGQRMSANGETQENQQVEILSSTTLKQEF